MSTTLLIGRCPAAVSRACSQSGEGPIVTSVKTRAVKRGQSGGGRVLGPGLGRQRRAGDRVDLAGDAPDPEAVGPVRGHLQLQHRLGDRQHLGQRRPRRDFVLEHEDAGGVATQLELGDREDHSLRGDPAQLRLAQLLAARHPRPGQGDGDGLAGGDVGRAADDRAPALAGVDIAYPQPVGVRVLLGAEHMADHEALARRRPDAADPLDLGPGHRQALGDLRDPGAGVAVTAQPRVRDLHPNCSSIRTSLSKKRRRSGTAWRSIATRSIPIPKAKPWTRSGS
jgi:hypothetical protein